MTWIPPSFVPQTYQGYRQCRRQYEQTLGPIIHTNSSISSPYTLIGIDPGTYCIVGLNGIYGNDTIVLGDDQIYLDTRNTTTVSSSGKLLYSHLNIYYVSLSIIYSNINTSTLTSIFLYLLH